MEFHRLLCRPGGDWTAECHGAQSRVHAKDGACDLDRLVSIGLTQGSDGSAARRETFAGAGGEGGISAAFADTASNQPFTRRPATLRRQPPQKFAHDAFFLFCYRTPHSVSATATEPIKKQPRVVRF